MAQDASQTTGAAAAVKAAAPDVGNTHATTEAAGGHEVFPPFNGETFPNQILWLAISFIVLYVVMSRVALPRLGGIIENRKARIDADLAAAEGSREKTDAAIAAYEGALADARRKSQALADETRSKIRADIDDQRKSVEADLAERMSEAERRISATKSEALGQVDQIAADIAHTLVAQLSGPVAEAEITSAVSRAGKE